MKRSKVFFIGFNKTATVSFHNLFKFSGYDSCHNNLHGRNIALLMQDNLIANNSLLRSLEDKDCYSDMTYCDHNIYLEANQYFKTLDKQYPNSYFVLQTRNVDDWIESRMNHAISYNPFSERAMSSLKLKNEDDLISCWKDIRETHYKEVRAYFKDNKRYTEFDIDNDNISKLINHVKEDYNLQEKHWGKYHITDKKRN